MNTTLKRFIKNILVLFILIAIFYILDIGCIFKKLSGLSCPGCGMTRAWLSFLKGDIGKAFYYHPLFWMIIVIPAITLIRKRISDSLFNGILICCIVLLMGCYLIRLFGGSDIVS
ncbi:MAG: DUF2752 domain-containing protein, partial [Solobacterium sp.]|nr:DUF2752 domain-containing protein [Solobacterium sp.]